MVLLSIKEQIIHYLYAAQRIRIIVITAITKIKYSLYICFIYLEY